LKRARETAEILNQHYTLPIKADDDLKERAKGKLEGQPRQSGERDFQDSIFDRYGENGESEWLLFLRASRMLEKLARIGEGRTLVVSHGGLMNQMLRAAFGLKPQSHGQGANFPHDNTAFSELHISPATYQVGLFSANDARHNGESKDQQAPFRIWLVRHGQSEGNLKGLFQGQSEHDLTAKGQQQARALGMRLKEQEKTFDAILCSPQSRARQTAEGVGKALNIRIESNDLLKEIDNGQFAGLADGEIKQRWPEIDFWVDPFTPLGFDGESWHQMEIRAGEFLQTLMERGPGDYLVVSHGGTLNGLLRNMLGIRIMQGHQTPFFYLQNTEVTQVNYYPETKRWVLLRQGDDSHLKDKL
jgi:broad specificity phosphatase PhoE